MTECLTWRSCATAIPRWETPACADAKEYSRAVTAVVCLFKKKNPEAGKALSRLLPRRERPLTLTTEAGKALSRLLHALHFYLFDELFIR